MSRQNSIAIITGFLCNLVVCSCRMMLCSWSKRCRCQCHLPASQPRWRRKLLRTTWLPWRSSLNVLSARTGLWRLSACTPVVIYCAVRAFPVAVACGACQSGSLLLDDLAGCACMSTYSLYSVTASDLVWHPLHAPMQENGWLSSWHCLS